MAIKVSTLLKEMLSAAKTSFGDEWPEIKEHAETELKGIAEGIALIERLRVQKKISQKQSKLLIKMKKNTAQIVLLTVKGLGMVATEDAINAALKSIKETVNTAVGFRLL